MLYNPVNDVPNLLRVAPFKDWLDRQPPEKTYNYSECFSCAIAQYVEQSLGYPSMSKQVSASQSDVKVNEKLYPLPRILDDIARGSLDLERMSYHWSFGDAAKRAEAILAKGSMAVSDLPFIPEKVS